jgi:hypothetical protein
VPNVPPGDVRWVLSDKVSSGGDVSVNGVPYTAKKVGSSPAPTDINLEGVTYAVKMADLTTYHVSSTRHLDMTGALVDWGANGGIAGSDCRVIKVNDQPQRFVNVEGIDGHVMTKTAAGYCWSNYRDEPRTSHSHHESICTLRKGALHPFISSIGMESS